MPEVQFTDEAALAQLARLLDPPVEEFFEIKGKNYRTTSAKTVGMVNGKLKVVIKSNEHPPPHFHVEYHDRSAS